MRQSSDAFECKCNFQQSASFSIIHPSFIHPASSCTLEPITVVMVRRRSYITDKSLLSLHFRNEPSNLLLFPSLLNVFSHWTACMTFTLNQLYAFARNSGWFLLALLWLSWRFRVFTEKLFCVQIKKSIEQLDENVASVVNLVCRKSLRSRRAIFPTV